LHIDSITADFSFFTHTNVYFG